MSQNLLWSLGMLLVAVVFLLLEFFIPSAGMLGVGAVLALAGALFLAFSDSLISGLLMSGGVAVALPILLVAALRFWPQTPIGRRILNLPPPGEELPWTLDDERTAELKRLVGRVGTAKTDLLPSGLIEVDGRRYDAIAQGTAIDRNAPVEVRSVEAGKIRVQPTNRRPATRDDQSPAAMPSVRPDTSLEDLNLEDLV